MGENRFDGKMASALIDMLDNGKEKMEALQDYIRQADEAGDDHYRLFFRYEYAYEATFHDDPPKAIPVAAGFGPIFEQNPGALPDGTGIEAYLMITQMGIDPVISLPQIPMEQWEDMMDKFYTLVKRYNTGLRTYWWQMTQFYMFIDMEKAYGYFRKFWNSPRDGISDCRSCERSYAVMMSLLAGDREAADKYAKPLKAGRTAFCNTAPRIYLCAYLENALNNGDLKEASHYANKLYWKMEKKNKNGIDDSGAVMRCYAYTDAKKALELLEQGTEWSEGMWDQMKLYKFYKGAWVVMHELARKQETAEIKLPVKFPLYSGDGIYNCEKLAGWFYGQAAEIGSRFDKRNGSSYYEKDLAAACACEGQPL